MALRNEDGGVIEIHVGMDVSPNGEGWAGRVVQAPIYVYADSLDKLEERGAEALQMWCDGFESAADLLRYCNENGVVFAVLEGDSEHQRGKSMTLNVRHVFAGDE